jgi:ParB-like chromosome segregation protein Spo0J
VADVQASQLDVGAHEVALSSLRLKLSPRLETRDADHIRVLAGVFDELPPILVHSPTHQVIDGTHRVLAARQLGRSTVRAIFRSGSIFGKTSLWARRPKNMSPWP